MTRNLFKRPLILVVLSFTTLLLYPQTFVEQTSIFLPGLSGSVTWGDYDKDGNLDILLTGTNSLSQYFSKIYRNNGNNSFTEQTNIVLTGISGPNVWGDFDNDGDLDILLTGFTGPGGRITKIYNNNGDNSFTEQPGVTLPGVYYNSVACGDYDNDGDLDILMTGQNSDEQSISKIYRNDGNNSFTEQKDIVLTGVNEGSVAWGDYDNDGDLDILLIGISSSGFITKIYRNDGNNSFSDQTGITLTGESGSTSDVAWGDYDNDGDLDILMKKFNSMVRIYRNNGNNNFEEQTGIYLPGVGYPAYPAWGDFDNDGDLDIYLTDSGIPKIYLNNGGNSFTLKAETSFTEANWGSSAWGDYDNDGDLDLIIAGYSGSDIITKIYRNETIIPNVKPAAPSNLQTSINNGIVTFFWDKASDNETPQNGLNYNIYVYESGQSNYECPPNAFRQSDPKNGRRLIAKPGNIRWSSSGYCIKDLPPGKTYNWSVQAVDAGLLGGSFSEERNFIIPAYRPEVQANSITFSNIQDAQTTAKWANGGGIKRVVFIKATSSGISDPVDNTSYSVNDLTPGGWKCVYNGTANSAVLTGLITNSVYTIQVCEFNGEPGSEKYLNSSVYENPATLNTIFTDQAGLALAGVINSTVAWGDYNNDGYLDFLLTGDNISRIYQNNGNNTFSQLSGIVFGGAYNSSGVWGDYDNDGDLDILLTGQGASGYISKIYRNDGSNSFTEQTSVALKGVINGSAAWGDFNNDGNLDILLTGSTGSGMISKIYRNNGDNSFTEQTNSPLTGVYYSSVAWGDYDNDNYLDILLTGATGDYRNYNPVSKIYRNNGENKFIEQTEITLTGTFYSSAAWGDYDNDGYLDILISGDTGSGCITKIYRNNKNNSFSEQTGVSFPGVSKSSLKWGDYDNDGDLDILLTGDTGTDYISKIYTNNGDNTFTELTGTAIQGVGKSSAAWGDYDNDGDLDILMSGNSAEGRISKIFRNEIQIPNINPSVPGGLQSFWDKSSLVFRWDGSSDDNTPKYSIKYNLRIGTTPGGNELKSSSALPTGKLLLPNISNLLTETSITLKLPLNKYYWSVQAVDKGGMSSGFATEMITPTDSIQAKDLLAFIRPGNSLFIRWKNGNGMHRVLFGRLSSQNGRAKPVDGITYHSEPYFGYGDKIGSTDWYCMYDGSADSTIIYGMDEGQSYDIQVIEYIEVNGLPVYFKTIGNANPGTFSSSLFSEQTGIVLPAVMYGSAAWGDYDNDGYLDILLTGSETPSINPYSKIYRNNGDNTFSEQTSIPLTGVYNGYSDWGDYDNDGDLDILLTGGSLSGYISKIYRNNGDNTFDEQTGIALTGVSGSFTDWGDYDNDGDLDILLTGGTGPSGISKVYRNNGNNSFTDQTGISLVGIGGSAIWGDYDNDGNIDILLSGYTNNPTENRISKIYRNNGNNTFTEQKGITLQGVSDCSTAWGDYDNDGYLDILLTGNYYPGGWSKIYHNNGNNTFTDQTNIALTGVYESSVAWGDFDNDGDLDILMNGRTTSNQFISKIYRNNGGNSFSEVTGISITGVSTGKVAWGDYDNDGDLDMIIGSKIFRNNTFMKAGNYPGNKTPAAPANLLSSARPDGIKLSWSPVKTDETSYKAMTYNVRIGTGKDNVNICPPHSASTGFRKVVSMGNGQMDTTFLLKNLASGNYYWSVQAVDQGFKGGAWSVVDSFEVRNVQTFYSADTVCLGIPTAFTDQSVAANGIASWLWDFKDGTTSSDQNPNHTYSASGNYSVKLVITDKIGVKDSLEQNIIIKPRPSAGFTSVITCQGSPTSLINTTDNNGLTINSWAWDFGDEQVSSLKNPISHGYLNPGDYSVKLKAVASNGCTDSIRKTVTVANYPIAGISANASLSFCSGDSVILSAGYNSNYTYRWLLDGTPITGADSSRLSAHLTGNYSIEVINTKGSCKTTSDQLTVSSIEAPVSPSIIANGSIEFCQGDSVVLSVTNIPGYKYHWRLNGGAVGTNSFQYVAKTMGAFTVEVENSTGCKVSSVNSIATVVNVPPSVSAVSLSGSTEFCQGESLVMSVPLVSGYTYQWSNSSGPITSATSNSFSATIAGQYRLTISDSKGCRTSSHPISVNVKEMPSVPLIVADNYQPGKCSLESPITLSVDQTVPGYTYQWKRNGIIISSAASPFISDFLSQGDYTVAVNNNGCKNESAPKNIFFVNAPEKPLLYVRGPVVWYMAASNDSARQYRWYRNNELIQGAEKFIYVANKTLGTYKVAIANQYGCFTISDEITIPVSKSEMTSFDIPKEYLVGEDADPFENLRIYPNPTPGLFTIEMDNNIFGELSIDIFSQEGRKTLNIKFEKTTEHFLSQIDLSGQAKGMYIINFLIEEYFVTGKVIVE
jgi:PKD repeat protein